MGRPQSEEIVAQAPREQLATTVIVQSNVLAASAGETINMYAPAGYISKIVSIRVDLPQCAGASSGFTETYVRFQLPYTGANQDAKGVDLLGGRATYNQVLKFNLLHWENADYMMLPPDKTDQTLAIKGAEFDDTVPLQFVTTNDSNGTLGGDRIYSITTINRQIAK